MEKNEGKQPAFLRKGKSKKKRKIKEIEKIMNKKRKKEKEKRKNIKKEKKRRKKKEKGKRKKEKGKQPAFLRAFFFVVASSLLFVRPTNVKGCASRPFFGPK